MRHILIPALFLGIWSTGFVVAWAIAPEAGPNLFLSARFLLAAAVLALLARLGGTAWPRGREGLRHVLAGGLLHGLYLGTGYWAVARAAATGSWLWPGRSSLRHGPAGPAVPRGAGRGPNLVGNGLGLGGVALAVLPGRAGPDASRIPPLAAAAALVSVAAITAGTLVQKTSLSRADLRAAGALQHAGGAAVTALLALLLGERLWTGSGILWLDLGYAAWSCPWRGHAPGLDGPARGGRPGHLAALSGTAAGGVEATSCSGSPGRDATGGFAATLTGSAWPRAGEGWGRRRRMLRGGPYQGQSRSRAVRLKSAPSMPTSRVTVRGSGM